MCELVACMKSFIVEGFGLPHFPDDFEPSMSQATHSLRVALAAFAELLVVDLSPLAPPAAQISPQMDRTAQRLIALSTQIDFVDLA